MKEILTKAYKCDYCDEVFTDEDKCAQHEFSFHLKEKSWVKKNNFVKNVKCCDTCIFYHKMGEDGICRQLEKEHIEHSRVAPSAYCDLHKTTTEHRYWYDDDHFYSRMRIVG